MWRKVRPDSSGPGGNSDEASAVDTGGDGCPAGTSGLCSRADSAALSGYGVARPPGGGVMARQGEVYISGTLLVSPCVLSDWATEMQSRNWVSGRARKVTLALEGCGTGETTTGLASGYGTPLHATGRWGRAEAFPLRLKNGVNYLTLPAPAGVEGIRLEMSYE